MLIQCTKKGCYKSTDARFNRLTGEVICLECGSPVTNVSDYTKRTLVSIGQILRSTERKPFQVHCPTCKGKRDVLLIESGAGALCAICKEELRVSGAVLHAIKLHQAEQKEE